jgi:RimJ/RimL family protein N-acetyltransferase
LDDIIWEHMLYGEVRRRNQDILSRPELPFVALHLGCGRVAWATRYLNMAPEHRGLEIGGTWHGLEYQRTAVNTECKYLLLRYAFETLGCKGEIGRNVGQVEQRYPPWEPIRG